MARIHVTGNSVLDVVVAGTPAAGPMEDGWGANVQLLQKPVRAALGGCGAGPAYLLARLGHSVSLSTNLGCDTFGALLTGWLVGAGVQLQPQPGVDVASATNVIHVGGTGRQSSYWRGERVDWGAGLPDQPLDWFFASGHGSVVAADLSVLGMICAELRAGGTRVLFDPSPWFAGRAETAEMLALWSQVDVLSATHEELACWLPDVADAVKLARAAVAVVGGLVVVKRGAEGAAWATADDQGTVATVAVCGNSVGAGDGFNARLVDGLARGEPPARAVAGAVEMATRIVQAGKGALGVFPPEKGDQT